LRTEVRDRRTWETQYQMVMALAECGHRPALPYLEELARQPFEATMVSTALGDAIVRLGRGYEDDPAPVLRLMRAGGEGLISGAFRAVAMLRLRLNPDAIEQILSWVSQRPPSDPLRFWVTAAAPGWRGASVEQFLEDCMQSPRDDIRRAASAAQQHKYLKWNPL
jgi:hypothetical protein